MTSKDEGTQMAETKPTKDVETKNNDEAKTRPSQDMARQS